MFRILSDAVGNLKSKMAEIDLFCRETDFDVFQKGDGMSKTAQQTLSQEYDEYPQVSDGAMLNFDEQTEFVSKIMEYGSVQTSKNVITLFCAVCVQLCVL